VTALLTVGCSMAGSWRTARVEPPGASFPVKTLSLDRSYNYTATWSRDGLTQTTTGQYRWNGFTLNLIEAGFDPHAYRARQQWGGNLVLSHDSAAGRVTATMAPIE